MEITQIIPNLIIWLGTLCVIVSVITELTKDLGVLSRIPTKLQVIVLSVIVTMLVFFGYAAYASFAFMWYHVAAAAIGSLFVAFITINGWDALSEIFSRFIKKNK